MAGGVAWASEKVVLCYAGSRGCSGSPSCAAACVGSSGGPGMYFHPTPLWEHGVPGTKGHTFVNLE